MTSPQPRRLRPTTRHRVPPFPGDTPDDRGRLARPRSFGVPAARRPRRSAHHRAVPARRAPARGQGRARARPDHVHPQRTHPSRPSPTPRWSPTSTRGGVVESVHRGSIAVTAPDGSVTARLGRTRRPGLPALVEQADPGRRDAAGRAHPAAPSTWPWPAPATRPSRSTSTACATCSPPRAHRGRPAEHPRPALRRRRARRLDRRRPHRPAARAELLGQARGHARHLPAQRLGPRHLPRPRPPARSALMADTLADLAGEPVAATAVDGCGAPVMAVSLAGLARAFGRIAAGGARHPRGRGHRRDAGPPRVRRRHPPRRHRADPRAPTA